jgi:hypothetical protein
VAGPIPNMWGWILGLDSLAFDSLLLRAGEARIEIRNQSQTGPVVPTLAGITATRSHPIEDMKPPWLDRWNRDPARLARSEFEIHDRCRHLADPMTASLLAAATIAADRAEPAETGGPRGGDRSRCPPETRRLTLRLLRGLIV